MKRLTVTLPDGQTTTRRTDRPYTHVLAAHKVRRFAIEGGQIKSLPLDPPVWVAVSWHETLKNARVAERRLDLIVVAGGHGATYYDAKQLVEVAS